MSEAGLSRGNHERAIRYMAGVIEHRCDAGEFTQRGFYRQVARAAIDAYLEKERSTRPLHPEEDE